MYILLHKKNRLIALKDLVLCTKLDVKTCVYTNLIPEACEFP